MRFLTALLTLCAALCAQVVTVTNFSGGAFEGFLRCNIDRAPSAPAGRIGDTWFVMGAATGAETHAVDVWCRLANGETRRLDLAAAEPIGWSPRPLPGAEHFGGPATLDGAPLEWLSLQPDGAAWLAHLHGRSGPMLHVDLWLTWWPDQPGWCTGEVLVTASNGSVPDLFAEVGPAGLTLALGDSVVVVPGRGIGSLVEPGTRFADGQARGLPVAFLWPRHLRRASDWSSAGAILAMGVSAVGVERVAPWGNPTQTVNGRQWATATFPRALSGLHTWDAPAAGITPNSTQTGEQEDQLYRGHELIDYAGAEPTAYLVALKWANRPCHHIEHGGQPINPAKHPSLVFWQSRPHPVPAVSPDRLGKPRNLAPWDVPGEWYGYDREHALFGRLFAAVRARPSPLLQHLLRHVCNSVLLGETIDPRLSTSHTDAARSVGYFGLLAVQLEAGLADRALAAKIRARAEARVRQVYLPEIGASPGDVWDPRTDDRILAAVNAKLSDGQRYAKGVMWWQQSLGAFGLDLLGEHLEIPEARALALRAADAVVAHSWRRNAAGFWQCWENTGLAPDAAPLGELREGYGAHRTGWFDHSWMVPGLAVILRHRPDDATARSIWQQVAAGGGSWVPPGIGGVQ